MTARESRLVAPTPEEVIAALERDCATWEAANPGAEVLWLLGRAVGAAKIMLALAEDVRAGARRWYGLAFPGALMLAPGDACELHGFAADLMARADVLDIEPDAILDELPRVRAVDRADMVRAVQAMPPRAFFSRCERALRGAKFLADNGLRFVPDRGAYEADPDALALARVQAAEIKELFDALMLVDPLHAVRVFQTAGWQAERSVMPSRVVLLVILRGVLGARAEVNGEALPAANA